MNLGRKKNHISPSMSFKIMQVSALTAHCIQVCIQVYKLKNCEKDMYVFQGNI